MIFMAEKGKGFYEGLEDKYYNFLDWLQSAGIPIYKIVDPIEEANIPTFPLAVLLSLAVIAVLGFFAFTSVFCIAIRANDFCSRRIRATS